MLQQHPPQARRRLLRSRLALGKGVEQIRHVQSAVLGHDDVQAGRLELDLGEGPCPTEKARKLEINEQTVEAHQRPPVGLLEAEMLDLEFEQERV